MTIQDRDETASDVATRIERIRETFTEARNAAHEPEPGEPKPDWMNGVWNNTTFSNSWGNFSNTWGNWCNLKT
jgi:hypothetical protein